MTAYTVQYELPVDNPRISVSQRKSKKSITFYVPVNHPDAQNMGFKQLSEAVALSGLTTLSTGLNTNNDLSYKESISRAAKKTLDTNSAGR